MIRGRRQKIKSLFWNFKNSDQQSPGSPWEKKKAMGRLLWRGLFQEKNELRLPTLSFLDIQYKEKPVGYKFPRHAHTRFTEFYFVDRGSVTFLIGKKRFSLENQQGILILPGREHEVFGAPNQPANILTVHFQSPDLFQKIPSLKKMTERPLTLNPETKDFLRAFFESLNREEKNKSLKAGVGFLRFLLLLAEARDGAQEGRNPGKAAKPVSFFAEKVETIIRGQMGGKITLSLIARQAGSSVSGLAHRYKDESGETVKQAILRCRIERAKELLRKRGMSVKETAHSTGFKTTSALSTVFRKMEGSTPGEYQKSLASSMDS